MIDTHCHIDLHDDPVQLVQEFDASKVECVAVTMLPSHYRLGLPHLKKFGRVHASLGMHPLRTEEGAKEVESFISLSNGCEFIGEVGLDFSKKGKATKKIQIEILLRIMDSIRSGKFVSVHSRCAAHEILEIFDYHNIGPVCLHYFSGGQKIALAAVNAGHYFSFNRRMLNGRQKALLNIIPKDRVLVESDAPFLSKSPITATKVTYSIIAERWEIPLSEVIDIVSRNFENCRTVS